MTIDEFKRESAKEALSEFEAVFPGDDRPRKAVEAAMGFASGKVSVTALHDAYEAALDAEVAAVRHRRSASDAEQEAALEAAWYAARMAVIVARPPLGSYDSA